MALSYDEMQQLFEQIGFKGFSRVQRLFYAAI